METLETIEPFKVSIVIGSVNENETLRNKLIETAGEMYMRLGLKSVSMDDVARQMGASKKTIYQVVDNKEALIHMVLEADACKDIEIITENRDQAKDAIDEFLRNSRYFIRQMRQISPATLRDLQKYYPHIWKEQMQAHHEEFRQSIAENIERGMEEGLYRSDLDAEIIATLYTGMMMMIVDTSIFPAQDRPLTTIVTQHGQYHLSGIVNHFGRERMELYLKEESLE